MAGDLDNQQKAFLEANIADQRKKHKETRDTLKKITEESDAKAQTFVRMQEQRYDQLIESHPARDLRRGEPLHDLGEEIKRLEEQIARETGDQL